MTTHSPPAGQPAPYVYPILNSRWDLGLFRVAGVGIGNSWIAYFHALRYARQTGAKLIEPAWASLKVGPILRGERSSRAYIGLFRAGRDDVTGLKKMLLLATVLRGAMRPVPIAAPAHATGNGKVTLVGCTDYRFAPLLDWRDEIRERLLEICKGPLPLADGFGRGNYVAAHVRLGDFAAAPAAVVTSGSITNVRIPLDWYENVLRRVRSEVPDLPIHLFSDGDSGDLRQLLAIDGVTLRREEDDVGDLMALAGARVLVGSQSTYSRWGAFLGNMPSIWLRTDTVGERFSDEDVPHLLVGDDATVVTRAALGL